jgi:oxygen-independent coproporphyrinogen III oxidase
MIVEGWSRQAGAETDHRGVGESARSYRYGVRKGHTFNMEIRSYELTDAERQTYRRYASLPLPRHTSYPIVPFWIDRGAADFRDDLERSASEHRPLSLYAHIPYCERLCYYCACTKEIVPPGKHQLHDPAEALLDGLAVEAGRFAAVIGSGQVEQVHFGGGSPTFLRPGQLERLWGILTQHFQIAPNAEIAIEVDPRITTLEHLQAVRQLGFNRVSLGVQDFDGKVQQAVNRIQPFEQVERMVGWCRDLGFTSINFDLIYGLPFQTLESMADTIEKSLSLSPDRIAFYRLAVIPEIFRWQKVFRRRDLPAGDLPLELNLLAVNRFLDAGYEFIGLDHFAKPQEALAQARRDGSLRRTFQGMTTGKSLDILGLGPSAISQLADAFAQNRKESGSWREAIATDFASERGLRLSKDDRLRRELMDQLYGHGRIDKRALENRFDVVFDEYFKNERDQLRELVDQGLVRDGKDGICLTIPLGRLLARVVAALFDSYLPPGAFRQGVGADQASKIG